MQQWATMCLTLLPAGSSDVGSHGVQQRTRCTDEWRMHKSVQEACLPSNSQFQQDLHRNVVCRIRIPFYHVLDTLN